MHSGSRRNYAFKWSNAVVKTTKNPSSSGEAFFVFVDKSIGLSVSQKHNYAENT